MALLLSYLNGAATASTMATATAVENHGLVPTEYHKRVRLNDASQLETLAAPAGKVRQVCGGAIHALRHDPDIIVIPV